VRRRQAAAPSVGRTGQKLLKTLQEGIKCKKGAFVLKLPILWPINGISGNRDVDIWTRSKGGKTNVWNSLGRVDWRLRSSLKKLNIGSDMLYLIEKIGKETLNISKEETTNVTSD
jgi:hypothetical protein